MSSGGTEKPPGGARPGTGSPGASPPARGARPSGVSRKPAARPDASEASGAERRRHARVAAKVPFRILDESGREEAFHLVDLSECGARIQVKSAIPPMTRIQVVLVLPGARVGLDQDVRVDTSGVVVWCHPTEGAYDTGVFFPDLLDDQRRLLRTLVGTAP